MNQDAAAALLLSAAAAAAVYWYMQPSPDSGEPDSDPLSGAADTAGSIYSTLESYLMNVDEAMTNANVQAFLRLIRHGESSQAANAYSMLYGGGLFTGFSDHPRQYFRLADGRRTSAAGAYQITATTWDDLRRSGWNLPDFSPSRQDFAAVALVKRRGALADVVDGRFDRAIEKCRNEWTSLPGAMESSYSMATAERVLNQYGATIETGSAFA
jgi:lysozyme